MEEKHCITITRQFGSLGRAIGKKTAELLGFSYYDRDIIESASPIVGDTIEKLSEFDDQIIANSFDKMMYPLGLGRARVQKMLFEVEKSIIMEKAHYEDCVIIGRCADDILKEKKNHLAIFIFAPFEDRLVNCQDELKLSKDQALKYMVKVDKAREDFYRLITGTDFDAVNNRQLLIDSSLLGVDGTADMIAKIARKKFQLPERKKSGET